MVRFLAALALGAAPVRAEMLDGAKDPAFRAALIAPRSVPAAATHRATTEGLDACHGAPLTRRDTLTFGP